jgi:hypothetical protein
MPHLCSATPTALLVNAEIQKKRKAQRGDLDEEAKSAKASKADVTDHVPELSS